MPGLGDAVELAAQLDDAAYRDGLADVWSDGETEADEV